VNIILFIGSFSQLFIFKPPLIEYGWPDEESPTLIILDLDKKELINTIS
jgi:hypothetical protein